jgi:hypothetical protein
VTKIFDKCRQAVTAAGARGGAAPDHPVRPCVGSCNGDGLGRIPCQGVWKLATDPCCIPVITSPLARLPPRPSQRLAHGSHLRPLGPRDARGDPPLDPHLGPNGQDHLVPVSPQQCNCAFAGPRALATSVDVDGFDPPPVLSQVALALLFRFRARHSAYRQRHPGQEQHGYPDATLLRNFISFYHSRLPRSGMVVSS